jgi:hypothetical protein
MQAIETKYHGPTNCRGSRIKASCEAGSVTVGLDHALNIAQNHAAACAALLRKLGWGKGTHGSYVGGALKSGVWVWVAKESGDVVAVL